VPAHLPNDPDYDAGVAVVDPATGDVLAAWSGRDFAASQVDLALGRDFGRPSGSTFKTFVLAAALEEGMALDTRYPAPRSLRIADWDIRGGGCGGRCTLREAIVRSVNTVFAQLGRDVGLADFTDLARRLGVRSAANEHDLSQALGTAAVTPLDMASAYATIANDGVTCPARVVREVRNPAGPPLAAPDPRQPTQEERAAWQANFDELGFDFGEEDHGRCYRALAPSVARKLHEALELAVTQGTGRNAIIGRPQAGKTGTTNDSREVWFAGYTPDISIAVFFGARDDARQLVGLPGCRRACFGGDIPARLWPTSPPRCSPTSSRATSRRRWRTSACTPTGAASARRRAGPRPTPESEPTPDPEPTEDPFDEWDDSDEPAGASRAQPDPWRPPADLAVDRARSVPPGRVSPTRRAGDAG
jgi:membrane peptidoglycan carboxypeptidase